MTSSKGEQVVSKCILSFLEDHRHRIGDFVVFVHPENFLRWLGESSPPEKK